MVKLNNIFYKLNHWRQSNCILQEWCKILNVPFDVKKNGVKSYTMIDELDVVLIVDFMLLSKQQKYEFSCLKKYGVLNVSQYQDIKIKKQETTFQHYGVKNPFQSNVVKKKIKQICLNKYGCEHHLQNDDIIQKREQHYYQKYGVINNSCLPSEKIKRRERMNDLNRSHKMSSKKYKYNDMFFDSSSELYFYIYHKEILKNDIQRGKIFEYFKDGQKHIYKCDFLVNGENIEIKGNHLINEQGQLINFYSDGKINFEKTKCLNDNNVKIILSNSDEMKQIKIQVEKNFPNLIQSCKRSNKHD